MLMYMYVFTMTAVVLLICLASTQNLIIAEELRWDLMHQNDYDIIPHHVEMKWLNKSYGKLHQLEFVKYNRSLDRTVNVSLTLVKDIGKKLMIHAQLYKFVSNTYKCFPINVIVDACKEYERNSFKAQELIAKYTNLKPCPQKPGFLYATYLHIDVSALPPFIPRGDYKNCVQIYNDKDKVAEVEAYGSVIDKKKKFGFK